MKLPFGLDSRLQRRLGRILLFGICFVVFPTAIAAQNAVPFINQTLPQTAPLGVSGFTLTVKGAGFASSSVVRWSLGITNTTLATSFVSSTQLTALVPASLIANANTASVTVFNPGPLGGTSNPIFVPITTPTSSVSLIRNDNPAPQSNAPLVLATGDFNGDGNLDLAVMNCDNNMSGSCGVGIIGSVSILIGSGKGTFSIGQTLNVGLGATSISVGDFNGDAKLDLAVTNNCGSDLNCVSPGNVSILLGNGDGSFTPTVSAPAGFETRASAVGDFNGDGKLDLAVVNCATAPIGCGMLPGSLSILLGNGDGTFTAKSTIALGVGAASPFAVAAGDFNADGKLDLAVANDGGVSPPGSVSILLGNGDGTFTSAPSPSASVDPDTVKVGDFNGDGTLDLIVGSSIVSQFSVLLGNGNGTFNTVFIPTASFTPHPTAVGDFNGDGKLDAAAFIGPNALFVLFGNGDGTFTVGPTQSVDNLFGIGAVVAGDLNGDGRLDLMTPVAILLQTPIVNLSPNSLDFGNQQVGTTSTGQSISLTNTGSAPLDIAAITASGDFTETNTCGTSVNAGAGCTINVTFTPTTTGARTGNVTITDNASPSPQSIALGGNGTNFVVSVFPAAETIPSGHDGIFTLSLESMGLSGNVTFTCMGSPPNSTCTISQLNGSNTATATIKLLPPKNVDHGTFTLVFTATAAGGASSTATASLTVK